MLNIVGRGLSPSASPALSKRFDLTTSLPREITFTRASAATCINSNGKLVSVATNTPRFDHAGAGRKLGLLIEGAVTNKNTNYNANPTATTGFNTSGDANGTLSVVSDSAALAAAGLDTVCTNGNVFRADNSAGSTNFVVSLPGTVGNTNKHSASLYIRSLQTGTVATLALNTSPVNISGNAAYTRFTLENQTPDSTSRRTTLTVPAGKTVYFTLNQLEESVFCSSVIITTGSSASRSADRAGIDNIHTYPWFNAAKGYMAVRYYLPRLNAADSYIAVLHDGSTANTIGLRLSNTTFDLLAYVRVASSSIFTSSNNDIHVAPAMHGAAITWKADEAMTLSGGMPKLSSAISNAPSGLTRLEIGARNGGTSPLQGHVQYIDIGHGYMDAKMLGGKLMRQTDAGIACGGQSLMGGHFKSQGSNSEGGKQKLRATMGAALPERLVVPVNGATGGSAASKTSNGTDYWWDPDTDTAGPMLTHFYSEMDKAGVRATAILWAQGEEDGHDIGITTTPAQYKESLEAIFAHMRARLGPIPVFIQRIGRRNGGYTNTGGVQTVRNIQAELIAAHDWCHDAAETFDQGLHDQVHLSDAGYVAAAERNALALLPLFNADLSTRLGPRITGAIRSGTSVSVTLSHSGGTDITPASSLSGFVFMDDESPITINAAVRTNATTITLTLNATPTSGIERLHYGYDDMPGINTANIVKDNATPANCLRTSMIQL